MQIEIILDPRLPAHEFARLGVLAEQAGIAAVWTSSLPGARDPFVNLVPLAMATQRLRIGAIAVNPFDTHPGKIAAALATLNEIAAGRAALVLGGGGEALAALGIEPRRRVRAVREAFAILRQSVAAPRRRFDHDGEIFRTRDYGCLWGEAPMPSLWLAANAPQMLAMAAQVSADIMMSDMTPLLVRHAIRDYRRQQSRRDAEVRFSNFVAWHVYDDLERARAEARQWLAFRGMFRRWVCTTFMSNDDYDLLASKQAEFYRVAVGGPPVTDVPERLIDALIDNLTITSSCRDLRPAVAHLCELRDAGLTQVALRLYQDVERSIETLGREIIPAVA